MNRKLISNKDFQRFNGQRVKVKLSKRFDGPRQVVGVLIGHSEQVLKVENEQGTVEIPRSEITKGAAASRFIRRLNNVERIDSGIDRYRAGAGIPKAALIDAIKVALNTAYKRILEQAKM